MKVSKLIATGTVAALVNVARVTGDMTVEWTNGNRVSFRKGRNSAELKYVQCDYSMETVWLSSELSDFNQEQQDMIAAAALKLGFTCIMINRELVSIVSASVYIVEPEVQRPATSWEGAKDYSLSQHRRPVTVKPTVVIESRKPTVQVNAKVDSKAGLMIAGGILLGLGILAVAAASSNNN
ncbi:hypothetical protein D3C78_965100 [compost metagenome]